MLIVAEGGLEREWRGRMEGGHGGSGWREVVERAWREGGDGEGMEGGHGGTAWKEWTEGGVDEVVGGSR